jgi:acyl-CoA synthetase (AMP-forming)/AMP-acid ligase II
VKTYTVKNAVETLCKWNARKELIVDGDNRYCGEQLERESRCFAQGLREYGVKKGDTVALVGTASCSFYAAFFSVHKLGAVSCNIHVKESAEFIARTLAQVDARLVVCSPAILATLSTAVELLDEYIPTLVLDDHVHEGATACYGDVVRQYPAVEPAVEIAEEDDAVIILSSGSTGTPKGIVHSQANFVRWLRGSYALFGAVNRNTRFLVNVGTSFAAWPFSSIPIIYAGGTIVLMEGFTPEGFCQAVEREKITMAGPVPTMIRMLDPKITGKYDLSSFEMVLCAGEAPTLADIERVLTWADTDIRCLYLASESAPCAATYWELSDYQVNARPVSAGKPVPGADLRIVDPDGGINDEVANGEAGEVLLRGPTLAKRYWKNPELTAQRFVEGWWRSGDIGHLDKDGYLYVAGRTDNTINTGGIKVHGEEVENCLLAHPDIGQAAVIGCPDPKWGQRIEAHIASSAILTEEALAQFCEEQGLAPFKRPKRYVFHKNLPVGVTGKLDRVTLREQYG